MPLARIVRLGRTIDTPFVEMHLREVEPSSVDRFVCRQALASHVVSGTIGISR